MQTPLHQSKTQREEKKDREMEMQEDIVIVGGGVAGLTAALKLHRLGLRSLVLEMSDSLRATGFSLTTWSNAWKALDAVGVGDLLRPQCLRLQSMVSFSASSGTLSSEISLMPCEGSRGHELRLIERRLLLETLANELPRDTIRFSSKVVSIEESGPYLKLVHLADGSTITTKVLIGCDGVNSMVGKWLGLKKPCDTGRFEIKGVLEERHGFEAKMMQFMGDGARYGILPVSDTSLYWFLTFSSSSCSDKEVEENPIKMKQFVLSKLGKVSDQVRAVIENTRLEHITCYPLRFRPPWQVLWGPMVKQNVCVAGDAFHPMTPDLGQGACSSLEDAIVLSRCVGRALLEREGKGGQAEEYKRIKMGLKEYSRARRWRAFDLVTTAHIVGFIEHSDSTVLKFVRDKICPSCLIQLRLKTGDYGFGV